MPKSREYWTAEELILNTKRNNPAGEIDVERFFASLPGGIAEALQAILSEFDYERHMRSNTAIGCRLLAIFSVRLEEVFSAENQG